MTQTTIIPPGSPGADFVRLTDSMKIWLLAARVRFVIRYSVPPETTKIGKNILAAECRWHHDHGIAVFLNWEINISDGDSGAAGGSHAGAWLKARARELGCPTSVPLFVSIDTDVHSGNLARTEQYVRAFAMAITPHPLGVYCDTTLAAAVVDLHPVFWRANAIGWGSPRPEAPVHIQQQKAVYPPGVDPNVSVRPLIGWLERPDPITPPVPLPAPEPPHEEHPDMFTWNPKGFVNAFLIGAGPAMPLSPEAFKACQAKGLPHIGQESHVAMLTAVLHQSGMHFSDLTTL